MATTAPSPPPSRTADLEKRRAANRENLRNHYGLSMQRKDSATSASGNVTLPVGKGKGRELEGDPLDIESPAFSAHAYYTHLVTTASLPQLVNASTSLTSDVKNLDSSRHSLVYNHHHQLFAAGDTISILNSRTPELEEIVKSLQESFDDISTLVDSIQIQSGNEKRDDKDVEMERVMALKRRVELMLEAGSKAEEVDEVYMKKQAASDKDRHQQTEEIQSVHEQIQTLIKQARDAQSTVEE